MIYSLLSLPQIIYIISVSVIVVLIVLFILLFPVRKHIIKKKFKEHYYRQIYKIAQNNDYYLINNFTFRVDDSSNIVIDHILFGEKYVYLISDFYFDGDIAGKAFDKSLILLSHKGTKYYVDNPILKSQFLLSRLNMVTNLDPGIMIGISLVNDECKSEIVSDSKQFYIISRNKLGPLIKAIESRKVGNLNAKSLEKLVQSINKMNKRKKK